MKTKTPRIDPLAGRLATYSASALAALAVLPPAMAKGGPGLGEIQTIGVGDFGGTVPSVSISLLPAGGRTWPNDGQAFSLPGITGSLYLHVNQRPLPSYTWGSARVYIGRPNVLAFTSARTNALKLKAGQRITAGLFPGNPSSNNFNLVKFRNDVTPREDGFFLPSGPANTGYIGLKFGPSGTYYGWLRLQVSFDSLNRPTGITFVGDENGIYGAFALAETGIAAGQTTAIPEPANVATGLALFALGAVGVREYRRRRKLAA